MDVIKSNENQLHVLEDPNDRRYTLVLLKGKPILRLNPGFAKELGKLLIANANRGETYANVERAISQEALLVRTGAPFAFTAGPIREEAIKDAQWDTKARKGMPMNEQRLKGAESAREVGLPSLSQWRNK